MHSTCNHHVGTDDQLRAYMLGDEPFPIIRLGDVSIYPPVDDPAAWLRNLSAACDDLAEQVELAARPTPSPGAALAEKHMAEAMAAAGIGGKR